MERLANPEFWRIDLTPGKLDMTTSPESERNLKQKYDRIVASGRGDTVEWLESEKDILKKAPHMKIADIKASRHSNP